MARKPRIQKIDINQMPGGFSTKPSKYGSPKFQKLENWWSSPDDYGSIEVVPGFASIGGSGVGVSIKTIAYGEKSGTDVSDLSRKYFITGNTSVWTITTTGTTASIKSGLTTGSQFEVFTYGNEVHFYNGQDSPFKYDFTSVSAVGLTKPVTTSQGFNIGTGTDTTNVKGVVKYWYSVVTGGEEGPLSVSFGETDAGKGARVQVAFNAGTVRRFYRSTRDGEVPFFLQAVDSSDTFFDDETADNELGGLPPVIGETPPTNAKFPIVHFNRIWVAAGSKLYWSDLGEPESWFSENYLNINENDGDQISGLARDRNGILVFKKNHLYKVIGRDPQAEIFQISEAVPAEQGSGTIGTPSHFSIASTPIGHIFYFNKGIYVYGDTGVVYLSEEIEDELRTDIDDDYQELVYGAYFPERRTYLISVPTTGNTVNSRTYGYQLDTRNWFRLSEGFTCFGLIEIGSDGSHPDGQELWAEQSGTDGFVQKLFDTDQTDFNGTAIVSEAVLPPIFLGSPGSFSSFLWSTIFFEAKASGSFVVNYKFDGESTGTDVSVSQVKSGAARWFQRVNLGQQATQVELSFKTSADQPRAKIFGLSLEGQALGSYNV